MDNREERTYPIVKIKGTKSEVQPTNPLRDEEEAFELLAEMVQHARPIVMVAVMSGLREDNIMKFDIRQNPFFGTSVR